MKDCPTRRELGARDLALLLVLAQTGIRVSELCALRLQDLDLVHSRLKVIAKGNRPQVKWLDPVTIAYLEAWLDPRKVIARHTEAVFVSVYAGQLLTRDGLGVICRRTASRQGVSPLESGKTQSEWSNER